MSDALYFEDFTIGRRFTTHGMTLTEADIIQFAQLYDPQPFHMDKVAAADSAYGTLIASGLHTFCVAIRMAVQENIFTAASMGSPGVDQMRWHQPVQPGDTLTTEIEVMDAAPSTSKPDRGRARMGYTVRNQHGDSVMTFTAWQILKRKPD
ncbi:Acyl dehydratase [Limimonas halophila]|uniref:Acyl dehydratase n=1 Tax=Limimonas halophila TaxID=1082479 RepID=A0A1G7L7B2_9PROT|nr:MaoC family dehydratase [Limimonas halophila]SDF45358.1 Acyl dehydratase [Limimonas halophila]